MRWLRQRLDRVAPTFEKGGKLHRWHPLWEAMDTFFYCAVLGDDDRRARARCDRPQAHDDDGRHRHAAVRVHGDAQHRAAGQPRASIRESGPARRLAPCRDRRAWSRLFALELRRQPRTRRALLPAALHRHDGGGPQLGGHVRDRAQGRGQRGLLRHRHPVPADPAADHAAVAGRARHQLRRGHREGSVRRHRHELHQPGAGGAGVPVLRLSGRDLGRQGLERGADRVRQSMATRAPRCSGRCA